LAQAAALAFGNPAPGAPTGLSPEIALEHHSSKRLAPRGSPADRDVRAQGLRRGRHLECNTFDQWGVEHGKTLARTLTPLMLESEHPADLDSSTLSLLARLRKHD